MNIYGWYFLAGLFIIGILIGIFSDKKKPRRYYKNGRVMKDTGVSTSYNTGKISYTTFLCPHCYAQLDSVVQEEIRKNGYTRCPNCGKQIS